MREFNDGDRTKKRGRISLPQNPGNLPPEKLLLLESAIKAAARDCHILCPTAWRIAADCGVAKLDVGAMIDRLGIRITDCQLGCFKVEKTANAVSIGQPIAEEIAVHIADLAGSGELTCANMERLATALGVPPLALAEVANVKGFKIKGCQLGCF
jgi:hypothetical protein